MLAAIFHSPNFITVEENIFRILKMASYYEPLPAACVAMMREFLETDIKR
jgi:hypothetical protein